MATPYRYEGKLIIDVSQRPALTEYGEKGPIYQASLRSFHRNDYAYGEGSTVDRAVAELAKDLGRTVDDLLGDAHLNVQK